MAICFHRRDRAEVAASRRTGLGDIAAPEPTSPANPRIWPLAADRKDVAKAPFGASDFTRERTSPNDGVSLETSG